MEIVLITANVAAGFYRCGRRWTREGVLVDLAEFARDEVERLMAEPMLKISEPTEEQLAVFTASDGEGEAELRFNITEAIRSLQPEDFQKDGKPRLDALKELLGKDFKITAALRDEIWEEMVGGGFTAPVAG